MPNPRHYRPADAEQVLELAQRSHAESRYSVLPFDRAAAQRYVNVLDGDKAAGWVVENSKGQIIGFTCMQMMPFVFNSVPNPVNVITYVVPEMRHTSAFAKLITAAERWARKRATHMSLGISGPEDVDRVVRGYEKMGFVRGGVFMRKEFE